MDLGKLSNCDLLHELLRGGEADLYDAEPISLTELLSELGKRAKTDFKGDVNICVDWYLSDESNLLSDQKKVIQTIRRMLDMEKIYIPKINEEKN